MQSQSQIQQVISLLSKWYAQIKLSNAIGYYDINKLSEGLSLKLLNIIFNLELEDLNQDKSNFPGIDLGDKTKEIAYQITSRTDSRKILETLDTFISPKYNLQSSFKKLKILVLSFDKVRFGNHKFSTKLSSFERGDVINLHDIVKVINNKSKKDPKLLPSLIHCLEQEFPLDLTTRVEHFFRFNNDFGPQNLSEEDKRGKSLKKFEQEIVPRLLASLLKEFSTVKTFLNPNLVPLYDVYHPLSLKDDSNREISLDYDCLEMLFSSSNCVSLFGIAGSGKSTAVKHLILESIDNFFALPIYIELRNLNQYRGSLEDYIFETYFREDLGNDRGLIHSFYRMGKVVFFFDGFDELYSNSKEQRVYEIRRFINTYDDNYFFITSRPGTNLETLSRFHNYYALPFSETEIEAFLDKNVKKTKFLERIKGEIRKKENEDYLNYITNPLLLSMYVRNYEYHPEIPQSKSRFYFNLFDTLYQRHDGESKQGWTHEKTSGLIREEFEKILQLFSLFAFFDGRFTFDKKYYSETIKKVRQKVKFEFDPEKLLLDLQVSLSIFIEDGLEYRFPHRTLQEYFCANCISVLDTDTKRKLYSQKFDSLILKTDDSLHNFWSLCNELDKEFFIKYFVIPYLEKLIIITSPGNLIPLWLEFDNLMDIEIEVPVLNFGQLRLFPEVFINQSPIQILEFFGIFPDLNAFLFFRGLLSQIELEIIKNEFDHEKLLYPVREEITLNEDIIWDDFHEYLEYSDSGKDDMYTFEDGLEIPYNLGISDFQDFYIFRLNQLAKEAQRNRRYSLSLRKLLESENFNSFVSTFLIEEYFAQLFNQTKKLVSELELELKLDKDGNSDIVNLI